MTNVEVQTAAEARRETAAEARQDAADVGAAADDAAATAVIAEAQAEAAVAPAREPLVLHMPVDVRSAALAVLAVLACVAALHFGKAVFVPLMVSVMLTYALSPLVNLLERYVKLPCWAGAAVVLLAVGGAVGWTAYKLSDNAAELLDALPVAAQKLRVALRSSPGGSQAGPLDTVQQAAVQIEKAAEETATKQAAKRGVTRVTIERPPFNVSDYLWSGTIGLTAAIGQFTLVVFLTYFALAAGDTFRRKLVKMTGPSLQKKKVTVHVLDDITKQIQRYLMVQIFTSALVGVATGLAFWALGLENAAVWGIVGGVTNLVPYIGSIAMMAASGLVAFLQFNELQPTLMVAGASLVIHTIIGNLLTPWLTGRTSRMNAVAVFVGVIFWGWLWGVWGLLLGIPIMMVVKAVCDRVEDLQPVGELLGD